MAVDLSKLKNRLSSLKSKNNQTQLLWKPKDGEQIIRIVPYKYQPDNPFIELKFHYGLGGKDSSGNKINKTYLSPDTFHRPDPIVEFSNRLKKNGSKDDWRKGREMEPKMRTFVPVLIRGEEDLGVRFWGFGKQVYEEILSYMADPEYGDITDVINGRDVTVTFTPTQKTGKDFPDTTIRPKIKSTPAVDPNNPTLVEILKNQVNILDLFPEPSYEDLKNAMNALLNSDDDASVTFALNTQVVESIPEAESSNTSNTTVSTVGVKSQNKSPNKSPSAATSQANTDDLTKAFDNLFNN